MTAERLAKAMEFARSGQTDAASALLSKLIEEDPFDPDALQLLGMVARSRKENERAAALFRRSLNIRPDQAHVHNNLGNALIALERPEEAMAAYLQAVKLQPDYWDAHVNLGLAYLNRGMAAAAAETLRAVVAAQPRNARAWSALGRALRAEDRLDDAIAAFRASLALRPNDLATTHNLAVALRLAGQAEAALELLRRCQAASPNSAEIRYNLGHCHYDLGRLAEAARAYEAAISLRAGYADAHDSLNRLYWQTGDPRYLASYAAALRDDPGDTRLLADLAHRLNLEGRTRDTIALLQEALADGADSAEIRHRLGQALWAEDQREDALAHYLSAIQADPGSDAYRLELAGCLIVLERYQAALEAVELVRQRRPLDQQGIALQGLAWRFLGDPRADSLNDYRRFVRRFALQPPPEWGDAAAFNRQLERDLVELHNTSRHPLEQTLRGGTQTMGDLFDKPGEAIEAVRGMIEDAVRRYIEDLPDDPDHVFLSRKSASFRFSGSWSVRLRSEGFHLNHLHSEGWISSCYYVGLPDAITRERQGWIAFGETSLGLGARETIASAIRPEVGTLVLFPSYMYHGTIPFEDEGAFRTTIAFDIVPA